MFPPYKYDRCRRREKLVEEKERTLRLAAKPLKLRLFRYCGMESAMSKTEDFIFTAHDIPLSARTHETPTSTVHIAPYSNALQPNASKSGISVVARKDPET